MTAAIAKITIHPVRVEMLGLNRQRVAALTIVADENLPEVVMFNGEPFLLDRSMPGAVYRQVIPFRADIGGA